MPALLVHPAGAVSLDEAHLAIEQWEYYSRKKLDGDQRLAVELMMAEGADGKWAARITGRAKPRQGGKGDEIEVVEFYGLTQRGEAIVHTAHEIPTARSAHLRMCGLLDHRDFRSKFHPTFGNGNFEIEYMPDGKRNRENPAGIMVYRTRTSGGGRGLDDISRLVVDEAQHAQPEQLASASPILSVNPNPQRNFLGTGGLEGRSDWWWSLRVQAIRGDNDGFAWLEHSAERVEINADGRVVSNRADLDPSDERLWPLANPTFGDRLPLEELRTEFRILGAELFAREHLCLWDPFNDGQSGIVPFDIWTALVDAQSTVVSGLSYGLAAAQDGKWAAVGSAGFRRDGDVHFDVVRNQPGTGWVVDYLVDLYGRKRKPIRIDPSDAAAAFIRPLRDVRVEVVEVSGREYQASCGEVLALVKNRALRHLDQPDLNRPISIADRRDVGKEGAWVWSAPSDISTLKAATLALSGVEQRRAPRVHGYDPSWVPPSKRQHDEGGVLV